MRNYRVEDKKIIIQESDVSQKYYEKVLDREMVAWDIETSGLEWSEEEIGTCQLYTPDAEVVIIKVQKDNTSNPPERLKALISNDSVKKVFHHAMFDLRFMSYHWEVFPRNVACTKISSKLLDPRQEKDHSLQSLSKKYLNVELDKDEALSNWFSDKLREKQIRYAARDVIYLFEILDVLKEKLQERNLLSLAKACFDHIPTRVQLDIRGYDDIYTY